MKDRRVMTCFIVLLLVLAEFPPFLPNNALSASQPASLANLEVPAIPSSAEAAPPAPKGPADPPPPVLAPIVNLSQTPSNSGYPRAAASGNHAYFVWADRGFGLDLEIYFRRSANGGASFEDKKNISHSSGLDSNFPDIAVSGDKVYVVWEEQTELPAHRNIMLAISLDNGQNFGPPVAISNTTGGATRPRLAVDGAYVWVIWSELGGDRGGLNIARSSDGGLNFVSQLMTANAVVWHADLAAAGRNAYVISTNRDPLSGVHSLQFWTGTYPISGTFSSRSMTLMAPVTDGTEGRVAAAGDNVYAFWRVSQFVDPNTPQDRFYFSSSKQQGTGLGLPMDQTVGIGVGVRSGYPAPFALAASGDDVYLAWVEVQDPDGGPRTSKLYARGSLNWGDIFSLSDLDTVAGTIYNVDVDVSPPFAHVVWDRETSYDESDVYAAASLDDGTIFSPKVNVSANPAESGAPSVASTGSSFHVAWMDYNLGNWEILYRQGSAQSSDLEFVDIAAVQAPIGRHTLAAGKPTKIYAIVANHFIDKKTTQATIDYDDASGHHSYTEPIDLVPGTHVYYLPKEPMGGEPFIRPVTNTLTVTLSLAPLLGEITVTNNITGIVQQVVETRPLRIGYRPLATPGEAYPWCYELNQFAKTSARLIEGTLPIDEREARTDVFCTELIVPPAVTAVYTATGGVKKTTIRQSVFDALTLTGWFLKVDKMIGVVRPDWFIDRAVMVVGLAPSPGKSAIVDSAMTSGSITAHEVAHNFGWVTDGYPGATDDGHLKNWPADGYWVVRGQPMNSRFDFINSSAMDPEGITVTQKTWISPATFNYLRDELVKPVSDPAVIGVRGVITRTGGASFEPWYRLDSDLDLPLDNPGAYRLRYLDGGGSTLAETGFDVSFTPPPEAGAGQTDQASFAYRIPDITGARKIALMYGGVTLAERVFSANPPTVTVTYPHGGETFLTGSIVTPTWTASDPDGDPLSYVVSFSSDGGFAWYPVTIDVTSTQTSFKVPENILSDQMLLKVTASDGINTTSDTCDAPFSFKRNLATAGCFGDVVNMTNSSTNSAEHQIAAAGSNAYMVWTESDPVQGTQLFFRRSADGGQNWNSPVMMSDPGYYGNLSPRIVATGTNVVLAWQQPDPGKNPAVRVSHDYGATFGPTTTLTSGQTFNGAPQLIADGDRLYAWWMAGPSSANRIYLAVSTDGGDHFGAPTLIAGTIGFLYSAGSANVAVSGSNVYVAYTDSSGYGLYFRASTDGGSTFSSPARLVDNVGPFGAPMLAASGGNVYLAWYNHTLMSGQPKYMYFNSSTNRGANFGSAIQLDQTMAVMSAPQMKVIGSSIHLLWSKQETTSSSNYNVYYALSQDSGAIFGAPINLSQSTQQEGQQRLLAFQDKVYVAWQDDQLSGFAGKIVVRASADGGESFGASRTFSQTVGNATWPQMALSGETVLLAWQFQPDGASPDILLARSVDCGGAGQLAITSVPPVLTTIPSPTVLEGTSTMMTATATDDNADAIMYWTRNLPSFATFEDRGDNVALLTIAPGFGQSGVYSGTTVYASDGTFTASQELTITVTAVNLPPVVHAGGPYVVYEGNNLRLDGSLSYDPQRQPITFAWQYRGQNYAGATVNISATNDYAGQATLRVSASGGGVQTETVEVTIVNLPPTVYPAIQGTRLVTFTDPGVQDTHSATIDWGDGTSVITGSVSENAGSGFVSGTHTYTSTGTYSVTVTVRDNDGGVGTTTFSFAYVSPTMTQHLYLPVVFKSGP